jgi:beta-glucosidase
MSKLTAAIQRRSVWVALVTGVVALAALILTLHGAAPSSAAPRAAVPTYQDPNAPIDQRVSDLLGRMTLAEKIGQMGQINVEVLQGDPSTPWDRGPLNEDLMQDVLGAPTAAGAAGNQIGSILSGGGAWPPVGDDGKAWADEINAVQKFALEHSRLGIPIIYGADAVHGHNNLFDATMVPHQIGLGATFDPALAQRLGHSTARAVRATGVVWDFAPVLDTQRDLRWGRSYEPFGEDPLLTGTLGAATIRGLQGRDLSSATSVVATAKHFAGYSAPDSGMDRTDATISDAEMQSIHLPSFKQGIDAGVGTVMVNSGSVNGEPVHASHHMLTDVLRGQLGFKGVVISDWQDVENLITKYHVAPDMEHAVALAFNAGLDMSMIPLDADGFTKAMNAAVTDDLLPVSRIDDAVSHILTLKFRLGLFEHPYVDASKANAAVEDPANRTLARKAAQESLVLLKNDGVLPFSRRTHRILVTGPASDSPANQLGGWSVAWQGAFGLPPDIPVPDVTTIRDGIQQAAGAFARVVWKQGAPVADTTTNRNPTRDPLNDANNPTAVAQRADAVAAARTVDTIVVAVGESPYAEGQGDDPNPQLTSAQAALIDALKATGKPVIVVVVAGRPLKMDHQLDEADAGLMAFLPGSEGGAAVADTLFGRANPSGRLSVSWPKDSSGFPLAYNEPGKPYDPRYEFGYGLSYTRFDLRALKVRTGAAMVRASVKVRNSGGRGGDDTVLAFVQSADGSRKLVAFTRVHLWPGSVTTAQLAFSPTALGLAPGTYTLQVGDLSRRFRVS